VKGILVYIFTALILIASIKDVVTIGHFYMNQEAITDLYCINKGKPEVMCSGKCYLTDSLQENHDEEKNSSNIIEFEKTSQYLIADIFDFSVFYDYSYVKKSITYTNLIIDRDYVALIFTPPRFV